MFTAVHTQCSLQVHLDAHTCRCSRAAVHTLLLPSLPPPPWRYSGSHGDQRCFYSQRQTSVRAMMHAWFNLYREETRGSSMTGLIPAGLHALCGGPQASSRPGTATQDNSHQLPRAWSRQAAETQEVPHHNRSAFQSPHVSANRCKYSCEMAWAPQGTNRHRSQCQGTELLSRGESKVTRQVWHRTKRDTSTMEGGRGSRQTSPGR